MNRRFQASLPLTRAGFTLVELLVVISIIGMLAALLLPAVNSAREAGRKSVCINNQRQLGLAIFQYEASKNEYPGYVNPQALIVDATTGNKVATRPIGWVFALTSRLERTDISDNYGLNAPKDPSTGFYPSPPAAVTGPYAVPDQTMKILVCPSDANASDADPEGLGLQAGMSYVVNCGMKDPETNSVSGGTILAQGLAANSAADASIPRDFPANGVFHYHFPYAGPDSTTFNYAPTGEKITKTTASSISDGTSTTLLLSENADSGSWVDILENHVGFYWQGTADATTPTVPGPAASNADWIVDASSSPAPAALLKINDQTGLMAGNPAPMAFGRPSSYHPGGVVVTYADAHSSFLNNDIDYVTYCLIMSPRGKYTQPANKYGTNVGLFLSLPTTDARSQYARKTLSEDAL